MWKKTINKFIAFELKTRVGQPSAATRYKKYIRYSKYPPNSHKSLINLFFFDVNLFGNSSFKDHILELEIVLARLSTSGMIVNISKSKFFAKQIQYLGYWINREGIQSIRNKG
jgi:hypothetical protein